jgi:ApeA N-terminal domain 1
VRIKEEFKRSGYFWLPSAPEKKLPGTLLISDGGNIELEVIGLFDESINALNSNIALKRIVGNIEKDGPITLDDCSYRKKNFTFGRISKSLVFAHKVFSGVAYEEDESISFNTFQFSVEGIDEWVGISGFKVDHQDTNRSTMITYLPPKEISLRLNNSMQLLITFSWRLTAKLENETEPKIAQKIYFKLVSVEERELKDFISIAHKITNFLCFAIEKIVSLEHVTATSDDIRENDGELSSIKIYYPSCSYSKDEPEIYQHHMLFRYEQIQNDAERIINNWIDAYDEIAPALNLYFATKTGGQKYLEGKFLALAQGLETYHRRTSDDKLMDEVEFKGFVENIVHQCPEEYKDLLAGKLKYGNEISLAKRIKSIIEPPIQK